MQERFKDFTSISSAWPEHRAAYIVQAITSQYSKGKIARQTLSARYKADDSFEKNRIGAKLNIA
jgi:hypothetical protein